MEPLALPSKVKIENLSPHRAKITIEPCYPGYGTTLGNALRRVLLSSLHGAAITSVKMKNAPHEFSALDNIKEDMVAIILNLKKVRFKLFSDEPIILLLKKKGEGEVRAKDFSKSSSVQIVNPEQTIATITEPSGEIEMEVTVAAGRGYLPVEAREKEKIEIGRIAIDATYTPIKNVNFQIENVRVGQMTNYDKLTLDISTDGTMSPEEAFGQAAKILVDHFQLVESSVREQIKGKEPQKETTLIPPEVTEKKKRGRPRKQDKIEKKE